MSPRLLPPWRPMSEFDPSKPAILHDEINDRELEWSGASDHCAHWRKYATSHSEGMISWDGFVIDRWREPVKH